MTRVTITTTLDATADEVWQALQSPATLAYVSAPLLTFKAIDPPEWPERWEERAYRARLRFLGVLPIGPQVIDISKPPQDGLTRFIRDNGHSPLIRRWDHLITVTPEGAQTRYTDQVDIAAGLLTWPVAAFARRFYRHRQKRWASLIEQGFAPVR